MQSLQEMFSSYLKYERRASIHTQKNYLVDLTQFLEFLEDKFPGIMKAGKERLSRVDVAVLREYMGKKFGHCSPSTLARKLATLRTFFQY